jgi:hypothetical protein
MKELIVAGLMLACLNSWAQSYVILSNGITLTTDRAGFIYDFGLFQLPYKVNVKGSNYFLSDKKLKTIDGSGFLFEKSIKESKLEKIKAKGGNYFINDDDHLFTVDANGFYYEFENDDKIFKKAILFGGNFFLVKPDDRKPNIDLYTVSDKGNYFKMNVEGLNPSDILPSPGNYFQTKNGVTYTVSKDGLVFNKASMKVAAITKAGGNYFIDTNGLLYTISDQGHLILPVLPVNIKISALKGFGANYVIDEEGRIFIIDRDGFIFERTISHDLRNSKVLSL